MLHAIDNQGNVSWHCHTPTCRYHNCQAWDRHLQCAHHAEGQRNQPAGESLTAHISHPGVEWLEPNYIALPPCPDCGSQTSVYVYDDTELVPPIIKHDEITGEILQVAGPIDPGYNENLWRTDADVIRKQIKHPTVEHLSIGQIQELQADIKNKAPGLPIDGLLTEVTTTKINTVFQVPHVARHRSLAEQLIAAGKVYQPPVVQPNAVTEQVFTRTQVVEIVNQLLQDNGLTTSPRLPAVNPPNATS